MARILEAVFEADFLTARMDFGRGVALITRCASLREQIVTKKVRHLFEADIRGYFNHINHSWLRGWSRIASRIRCILSLIGKWLRAGVMQDGVVIRTRGGNSARRTDHPLLANVYLHFVLDLWFEKKFKP